MDEITDLAAGTAAEHLVCADVIMQGMTAYLTDQNCAYDIMADTPAGLVRIQVKATRGPRAVPQRVGHHPAYMWHVRRRGRAGLRTYQLGEFDVLALVALDIQRIAYMPPGTEYQTVHIRPPGTNLRGKHFNDFPLQKALAR